MVSIKIIYGTEWCGDCKRSKKFLDEYNISYMWIDIDFDEKAKEKTKELNEGKVKVPTIVFDDETVLVEPSNFELADKLGIEYSG
ncbi:MAG: glutaredoxin domain-containing protein [Candidatus Thorarchaeota archaeon]